MGGMKLPSETPSYYRRSFDNEGKKYVQIWFKLPSKMPNHETVFTIFNGRVITKTRRKFKVKVYINRKTHRVYYTDDTMKPAGRTVSVKLDSAKALDKWHSVFLSSKLINGKVKKGPTFQTCLGVDDKNCESVSEDPSEDTWGA